MSLLGVGASAVLPRAFATPAVLLATVQRQARATVEGPRAGGDPRRDTGVRVRVNRTESGFPAEEPTSRIKANGAPHAPAEPFVVSATTFELPYPDAKRVLLNGFNKAYVEHKLRSSGSNVSEAARRPGSPLELPPARPRHAQGGGPESEAPDAPDGETDGEDRRRSGGRARSAGATRRTSGGPDRRRGRRRRRRESAPWSSPSPSMPRAAR